jgi:N-acetylgalactosamine 4-sulfate 6-O-sulfotransferase
MWRPLLLCVLRLSVTCSGVSPPVTDVQRAAIAKLASQWEPELFGPDGATPIFNPELRSPCVDGAGSTRHCVPGAYLIGNWQSNAKGLGAIIGTHPDIVTAGNDRCFGQWRDDKGGRKWLRQAAPPTFDPKRHLLAALGCVTSLIFYPGFAGRFHKYWERAYWPCKAECNDDPKCAKTYYEKHMWPCKSKALAAHDQTVAVPGLNATPPYLMHAFYGVRVKLITTLRSPIDRLRHAFYQHPHYAKRYGQGANGLHAYSQEQAAGWKRCVASYGARRCAIHFEQLSAQQGDIL